MSYGGKAVLDVDPQGNILAVDQSSGRVVTIGSLPLTAAQIASPTAAQLANTSALYQLNTSPYTLYQSNGSTLVSIGGAGTSSSVVLGSGTGAASSNVSLINAALSAGGLIQITKPGTYYFNNTLTIPSKTEFYIGPGVTLRAVTGGPAGTLAFPAIVNTNYNSTPITVTSITAAGIPNTSPNTNYLVSVTVTFASAHGISAGGYVQIKGDGYDLYNGVWEVYTVPSSTTLTFIMSISGGSTTIPPNAASAVASASQTVATPGVFTTAANTFVAGQAVTLSGSIPGGFASGTIYYVIATGLTTTTCQLALSPFAASGIAVSSSAACTLTPYYIGAAADGQIKIGGGGTINMDFSNGFTVPGDYRGHGIILRRVLEARIDRLTIYDVDRYCILFQDVKDMVASNVHMDSSADGMHTYGPAWNPRYENITGTTGDDFCIFQPIDASGYTVFMLGSGFDVGGNFYNGLMKNIRARHNHNSGMCVIYPNGNVGDTGRTNQVYAMLGNIVIEQASVQPWPTSNANWSAGRAVVIAGGYVTVPSTIESLMVRDVRGGISMANGAGAAIVTIRNMTIENWIGDSINASAGQTLNPDYMTVDLFNLVRCRLYNQNTNQLFNIGSANNVFTAVNLDKCEFNQIGSGQYYVVAPGFAFTLGTMNVLNCIFGANTGLYGSGSFANTPTFNITQSQGLTSYLTLIANTGTQAANVYINGFNSVSPQAGLFNIFGYSGTMTIICQNVNLNGGAPFANLTGTVNFNNPDGSVPVDLSKITRQAGALAKSQAGNGTIVAANLAVCDATNAANSWKQLSNTTLVY